MVVAVQLPAWPLARLAEAVVFLGAGETRDGPVRGVPPVPPASLAQADDDTVARWLESVVQPWALEVEPLQVSYGEMGQVLRRVHPMLCRLPTRGADEAPHFLVILTRRWGALVLLGPDGVLHRVAPAVVREAVCAGVEAPQVAALEHCLAGVDVPLQRGSRARQALLDATLAPHQMGGCWLVRLSPRASLWAQARRAHVPKALGLLLGGYVGQLGLLLLAWWLMGQRTLTGVGAWGWLRGWAVLVGTALACQSLTTVAQSQVSRRLGGLIKQRLLYGVLHVTPDEIQHQGAGHFLGRLMEAEAVELLALGGGWLTLLALVQLSVAAGILALGAVGGLHAWLLLLWVLLTVGLGWSHWRRSHPWMATYRAMTQTLIEHMVGHRTRLAQEDRAHWHDEEDQSLEQYVQRSVRLDRTGTALTAFIPRGWSVVGVATICYGMLVWQSSVAQVAISLGGLLLAFQALTRLVNGTQSLLGALLAWQDVAPFFQAAQRGHETAALPLDPLRASEPTTSPGRPSPILTARDLRFRYRPEGRDVLRACSLQVWPGERVLLEGPSGSGKSTLVALLGGLRAPESGMLLLGGYDHATLGTTAWRRRVVVVPQFHENHVLSATLAFNLLLGRRWPPQPADLAEAEAVCRVLGLGEVLDRMPSGLHQMIGEQGWHLSHGEQSRLYIARALLQPADVVILDESFGALDPENLQRTVRAVLQRAPALLVIAHP